MPRLKILITGSSGYVGYIISKYFSEKGIEVIGLDVFKNHDWEGNKHFKFYMYDIRDREKIEEIISKEKPTTVIHLAYLMKPIHDTKKEYAIDVTGSKNILELSNSAKEVKQFIKFSSASAYGAWPNNKLWIKEEQPLKPRDYRYGINKKIVEEYYNDYPRRKDLKLIILRMCTAIGPLYHKKGGVVSMLINSPIMTKFNNRYCELQFLHEDDLNNLMDLIINDKKIEGTYNFAPDSYATTKDLAKTKIFIPFSLWLMRGATSLLWGLRLSKMRAAAIDLATYGIIIDPTRLTKRYNYKFKYTTKSGFEDTVKKRLEKGTL